jgi:hypothetical protein
VGATSRLHGDIRNTCTILGDKPEEKIQRVDLAAEFKEILNRILKKYGLDWLQIFFGKADGSL